jgi:hypothetical protein
MLKGTPVRRKASGRPGTKANGHRRGETVVPLPSMPEDDYEGGFSDRDFDGYRDGAEAQEAVSGLLPIQMEGDGPLVVREKFHASHSMTIDQALFEMELVGHAFFAYHDSDCGAFSVVYRRCGYDYGVIRLVDE